MEVKVIWTDSAILQLEDIFDYYKLKVSLKAARRLALSIVETANLLKTNPLLGSKEPLLINRKGDYRFLIERNYKIIYLNNPDFVSVVAVFDCRRNPTQLNMLCEPAVR
jgi:plasmid stabilization system protein ParE